MTLWTRFTLALIFTALLAGCQQSSEPAPAAAEAETASAKPALPAGVTLV